MNSKPTDEQLTHLRAYRKMWGRMKWKAKLREAWEKASAVPCLIELRNTHGPSWLAKYRLPD